MTAAEDSMFDLTLRPLADGGLELSQLAGSLEEPALIHLHRAHVRLVAEYHGRPDPNLIDRLSANHVRRVRILRERVDELGRGYYDEIIKQCASGFEIVLHLRALDELVAEMCVDLGIPPERPGEAEQPANAAQGADLKAEAASPSQQPSATKGAGQQPRRPQGAAAVDLLTGDPSRDAAHGLQREQRRAAVPA